MISTENYLETIAPKQPYASREEIPTFFKVAEWIHDHPKTVTITRLALDILSLSAIASAPIVWGALGVVLGVVGLIGLVATELVHRKLAQNGILATPIGTHVFQEGKVEGGRLYTQGNIPILELDMEDPYKAGRAQGKLLAKEILQLQRRVAKEANFPKPEEVQHNLEKIKKELPHDYLREMQGLVDGVNSWIDAQPFYRSYPKATLDELMLAHLMPDSLYYSARSGHPEVGHNPLATPACTVVIDKNDRSGLVFGRNMDWPSFGLAGKYSLVINRKYKDNATVEIGVPGILGTLTGMNSHGLSLSMNVCAKGTTKKGIPACFYNRMALEQCQNVADTRTFVDRHNPLGSYHLSVADEERAQSYHFYQGEGETHVIRKLQGEGPLTTTNCSYCSPDSENRHMHSSEERRENIQGLFNHAARHVNQGEQDLEALVAHSLTLPFVNNVITAHSVEMVPHKRLLRVSFDNSFAASHPLQELDARPLLNR